MLRNAVTLSCLLGKPVHISRIRAGRTKPGLRPQHLTGIQVGGACVHCSWLTRFVFVAYS